MANEDIPKVRFFDWRILPLLAITAAVLYVLVDQAAGMADFTETLKTADATYIGLAFGILVAQICLGTYRLQLTIRVMGHHPPFLSALNAVLSTWPLAVITPSRASDVLRAWVLRDHCPVAEGAGAIVAEKLIDVQSLCLLSAIGGIVTGLWQISAVALLLLAAEWVFLVVVVLMKQYTKVGFLKARAEKIESVLRVFNAFQERPAYFLGVCFTSILAWIFAIGIVICLSYAFSAGLNVVDVFALWPLAIFVGMLPLTVSGMGTRDAAFLALLTLLGRSLDESGVIATTIGYSLLASWVTAVVGVPFMLRQFKRTVE